MSVNRTLGKTAFQKQLAFGQMAETLIARWLISKGKTILPIYDIEYDTGKGPRVFGENDFQYAAPDLLVWSDKGTVWCEAKHKTVFSWYRKSKQWETGIDLNHWTAYQKVAERIGLPVWLLFLHRSDKPSPEDLRWDCPAICPAGLFGNELSQLTESTSHTSHLHGRHGMIYWAENNLLCLASLEEMLAFEKVQ